MFVSRRISAQDGVAIDVTLPHSGAGRGPSFCAVLRSRYHARRRLRRVHKRCSIASSHAAKAWVGRGFIAQH